MPGVLSLFWYSAAAEREKPKKSNSIVVLCPLNPSVLSSNKFYLSKKIQVLKPPSLKKREGAFIYYKI